MKRADGRRWIGIVAGLTGALLWSATLALPHLSGRATQIDGLEATLVDLRLSFFGPKPASDAVVIVAIDDATLAAPKAQAMDGRERLARLIENIAVSGARALAIDVLFSDQMGADSDAALVEALGALPTVIAAAANFDPTSTENTADDSPSFLWPQSMFQDVAQAGLVNLSTDMDGTPRYAPLLLAADGALYPSLSLLAAISYAGITPSFAEDHVSFGTRRIPLDAGFNMPLRLLGPAGTVPTYSAQGLLDGPMANELTDKMVVLGFTASAMGDRFSTPFDDSTPGVEIIATVISQLLDGPTLRRDAGLRKWDAGLAIGVTLLCTLLVLVLPLSIGVPASVAVLGATMIGIWGLFAAGLWMSAALPLAAALPPMLVAGVVRYARERRGAAASERAVDALKRFHSPALATRIAEDPSYLAEPVTRDLVIFFVDLTAFTALSQQLGQDGTQTLLKTFHAQIAETVEAEGGSVFNYMGDGALAIFGLEPDAKRPPADGALSAAFALVDAVSAPSIAEGSGAPLGCRIGLHAGPAILSRLGASSHQQVTATGDTVNLASRLMEVAKDEKAVIVASRDVMDALAQPPARVAARTLTVPIRGRAGTVEVVVWPAWDLATAVASPL